MHTRVLPASVPSLWLLVLPSAGVQAKEEHWRQWLRSILNFIRQYRDLPPRRDPVLIFCPAKIYELRVNDVNYICVSVGVVEGELGNLIAVNAWQTLFKFVRLRKTILSPRLYSRKKKQFNFCQFPGMGWGTFSSCEDHRSRFSLTCTLKLHLRYQSATRLRSIALLGSLSSCESSTLPDCPRTFSVYSLDVGSGRLFNYRK